MRVSCSESRLARALVFSLLPLTLAACGTLSIPEEKKLGDEFAHEVKKELTFLADPVVVGYVRRIGNEVLRAAGPQPFEYTFYVVENETVNAFAMPAGHIYMHTETILQVRNVSELAGVIAHEVGHVVKRHIARNYNRQRNTGLAQQLGVVTAGVLGGNAAAGAANIVGGLGAMAYLNRFGRDAEREADAFAVEILPRAGIHPRGLVTFFETLRNQGGSEPPAFLSNHPATSERIATTRRLIADLPLPDRLRMDDAGRLEIIQRRIKLLTGRVGPGRKSGPR